MLNVGSHNYFYFNQDDTPLLLTVGDCEYRGARRFIDSVPQHCFDQLCTAILRTIWIPNRYNVQNERQMTFLFGQADTQEFINIVSEETTFFGLVPMESVCVASLGFYPFHDLNARWELELAFGPAADFHQNTNPHQH